MSVPDPATVDWVPLGGYLGAKAAKVATSETTAVTTYTDLATVGPSITLDQNGTYAILLGFTGGVSVSYMSFQAGAVAAVDADACRVNNVANLISVGAMSILVVAAAPITVTAKYKSGTGTSTFLNRWLTAVRL